MIQQLHQLTREADAILIGAGAGLSAAAGLSYSGDEFRREFRPWIERYGITDLYSSSFYPFPTEEERWAYWARHIWFARFRPEGMPLYRRLKQIIEDKIPSLSGEAGGNTFFVITTNVDAQFEKAGFPIENIFATQGDYAYLQARSGQPRTLIYNEEWVREAMAATRDCRIPTELVPRHPETGELMSPNLRCDETFVEDEHWHLQAERYRQFIEANRTRRLLLLEFGVGFNPPGIIRFPFERMAAQFPHTTLVRFNRDDTQLLTPSVSRFLSFNEELQTIL